MSYPCATTPSCGGEHDQINLLILLPTDQHHVDHAKRYVEVVQKLQDRTHLHQSLAKIWYCTPGGLERTFDEMVSFLQKHLLEEDE